MAAASSGPQPWKPRRLSPDGSADGEPRIARLPYLERLRRVPWNAIPEHSVVLAGADVNGAPPPELLGFPPMNRVLREGLLARYHFLPNHAVLVAEATSPVAAVRLSNDIRTLHRQITSLRDVLGVVSDERERLLAQLDGPAVTEEERTRPTWEWSGATERSRLVKDRYASFTVSLNPGVDVPSFLFGDVSRRVSVAELILYELKQKRFIPADVPVALHLILDVSFSMKRRGKLDYAIGAVNQMASTLSRILSNTTVRGYVYSETVRKIDYPMERVSIPVKGTRQAPVMNAVLRNRDRTRRNKVVLITDGEPEDRRESIGAARALREAGVDYTQILLHHDDDLRYILKMEYNHFAATDGILDDDGAEGIPDEEIGTERTPEELHDALEDRFDAFTAVAEEAGGNQIVLTLFPALALVNLEVYDRYLGLLTLL